MVSLMDVMVNKNSRCCCRFSSRSFMMEMMELLHRLDNQLIHYYNVDRRQMKFFSRLLIFFSSQLTAAFKGDFVYTCMQVK